jgi:Tfp pilus assembly protein PilF
MQAREILEHAVRIDVTQPGPHKTSAELEMDLGQFERARLILLKGQ